MTATDVQHLKNKNSIFKGAVIHEKDFESTGKLCK